METLNFKNIKCLNKQKQKTNLKVVKTFRKTQQVIDTFVNIRVNLVMLKANRRDRMTM